MAKTKATHTGTCQACGAKQKLPGGSLSKHGYRVQWGYFSGVCYGAHERPLEEDRSVLDRTVVGLRAHAEKLITEPPAAVNVNVADARETAGRWGARKTVPCVVENTFEAFAAKALEHKDQWFKCLWSTSRPEDQVLAEQYKSAVQRAIRNRESEAKQALNHAEMLLRLADEVHGKQNLTPVS